jgi:hypothetical protein
MAKNKPDRTEQEELDFKMQLQQEVDQFKTFFLSISRAWEDYMISDLTDFSPVRLARVCDLFT